MVLNTNNYTVRDIFGWHSKIEFPIAISIGYM